MKKRAMLLAVVVGFSILSAGAVGADKSYRAHAGRAVGNFAEVEITLGDNVTLADVAALPQAPGSDLRALAGGRKVRTQVPAESVQALSEKGAEVKTLRRFVLVEAVLSKGSSSGVGVSEVGCSGTYCYGESDLDVAIGSELAWYGSGIDYSAAPPEDTVMCIDVHYEIKDLSAASLVDVAFSDANYESYMYPLVSDWDSGGDIIGTESGITAFNGETVSQAWFLWATDYNSVGGGYIDYWWVKLYFSQDYCPAGGSSCDWEYVGGVEVGDISNFTGCSSYTDYTSLSTTMEVGQSYPITITNGYPFNGEDHCGCWVDWNGDKNFDDAGEAILLSVGQTIPGGGIETFVGTITPPVDANPGQTRLRIRMLWWETLYPCDFTAYGEVEDYTITVPAPEPKYSGGDGSAENPYRIATAEDLNAVGANPEDWDEHFVQVNDIDLSQYTGAEFNVIGYYHTDVNNQPFTGGFDGNGHIISNFTHVGGPYISYLALFGYVGSGGEITDVGIVNYNVAEGGNGTAPLVALLTGGQVSRCWSSTGTISGNFRSGGLVGQVSSGTVSCCFAKGGQISAVVNFSGGLVGENGGSILDCYSTCSAGGGSAFYIGGLVGYNHGGSIANCYSTNSVSGNGLGGLVGYNTGTVVDSFWDIETSGIGTSDGGTGLDTEQMQTASTYIDAGWDFATPIWTICEGKTYPHLWWEYLSCEKYGGGSGTAQDPYLIFTADHMDNAAQYSGDWDKHFKLMADVDMSLCSGTERAMVGEYLFNVPRAIALDVDGAKLYWADWGYDVICRGDLDGAHREEIITAPTPLGLAIDAINDKIYWTDNQLDNIQRADLDGGNIEELVTGLTNPVGIALDVAGGKMYWVDKGTGELERANLDGSGVETILSGLQGPDDLGLDLSGSKVYWTENSGGTIGRANLDGSQAEYVVTGLSSPYGIVVDATSGYIYWSDNAGIHRAELDGVNQVLLISAGATQILDLDIDFGVGKIYWVGNSPDNPLDKMCRADLDGSDIEVLMRNFFTGVFDGGGHTVRNFAMSYSAKDRVGIFGVLETSGAVVKNLGVVNPVVDAPSVERVGGLIGQIFAGTVEKCFVKGGSVTGAELVGGLTGAGSDCSIVDCYTETTVTGDRYVGGMMGLDFSSSFSRCYAATVVDGNTLTGGLIGGGSSSAFGDCFWDVEVSGQSTSDGGTGLDTEQMQTASTYIDAGWDFATPVWWMCTGPSYPHLWYEDFDCPKYGGGSGTAQDPYQIWTAEQMNEIGASPEDWDKHFEMISDIDLSSYTGDSFNIIGTTSEPFFGVFDGNGHKISNFSYESRPEAFGCVGLFGTVGDEEHFPLPGEEPPVDLQPVIKNIRLMSPTVSGSCGGSLIAFLERGSCLNCYATDVNVTVLSWGGGLIGGITDPNSVMDCFVSGKVSGGDLVGGFTGLLSGGVNRCAAVCNVVGHNHVGGLLGHSAGTGVHKCYSYSNVSGNEDVGGLTGSSGWGTIDDCYSVGSVDGNSRVGGLSGDLYECDVLRCYAACEITNVGGGLVGRRTDSSVSASFWDVEVSKKTTSAGGTGKTTEQMQMMSTYTDAGWDFVDNWDICEGTNYPRLIWQIPAWDFLCPDGVDGIDYAYLSGHWQDTDCAAANDCDRTDLDFSGVVDWADLKILCGQWLQGTP